MVDSAEWVGFPLTVILIGLEGFFGLGWPVGLVGGSCLRVLGV